MNTQKIKFIAALPVMFFLSAIVSAQSGGTFTITKSVIARGGGQASGGTFTMDGTIGQSVADTTSTGGTFNLQSGFWTSSPLRAPFDF